MSNIKALEDLRVYANGWRNGFGGHPSDVETLADRIEREIAERFMPLPCDADGVPIHTGDLMERCCAEDTERFTAWFFAANGDALDDETLFFKPSECRHYKPRTIEDVLREFAERYLDYEGMPSAGRRGVGEALMDEYADEIRNLMGGSE